MSEVIVPDVMEEVAPVVILDLGALAEFASKPVYTSANAGKKLYENTVEDARELVKVRNQDKVKKEGIQSLGLNLGRNLLPLDKIQKTATRLVVKDEAVVSIEASLLAAVKAGTFDEEIAVALETAKATAMKMAATANKKNEVDASVPIEADSVEGLNIDALEPDDGLAGIETI